MSNFWATKLGMPTAPQPAPAPVQSPVTPWYAPPQYHPQPVPQQPQYQPQQFAPQVPQGQPYPGHPQAPQPEQQPGQWGTIEGSMQRARSAKLHDECPECGSSNYFQPQGIANAMKQCYSCGYNPRFSQTGGEGGLPSSEAGPATPARQTSAGGGGGSQFRPDVIVGRV